MKTEPLSKEAVEHALTHLSGWTWQADALVKTYTFGDFREAMAFMLQAGFEADAIDHHPEWTNSYNKVLVRLTTHDAGDKITTKDVELAGKMDKIYKFKGENREIYFRD